MLSRLLQPLRNIIPVASRQGPKTESSPTKSTMVTTRQQSVNKVQLSQNGGANTLSVGETPVELPLPRKRRRAQEAESAESGKSQVETGPSPGAKRQKLPVRSREDGILVRHSHVSVVIPVRDIEELQAAKSPPSSQKKGKVKQSLRQEPDAATENEDQIATKEPTVVDGDGILKSTHEGGADATVPTPPNRGSKGSGRGREKGTESKAGQEPIMEGTQGDASASAPKPKHKRFGSEEPTSEEIVEEVKNVEDADESSDDDAPEVVATHDAEESIKTAAREISKAAGQQEAAVRKKRRERDIQLKEQAAAASKKRRRMEDAGATPNGETENSITPKEATSTWGKVGDHPDSDLRALFDEGQTPRKLKITIDKSHLPEFLPAEYLEDTMEIYEDPTTAKTNKVKYPKKKIFADIVKKPRDRTKGNTTYRVSEAQGIVASVLAPAAAPNARSVKEAWMRGIGRHSVGGNRRVMNAGFFVRR